jgi:hypothetical protein
VALETEPGPGAARLRVLSPARFLVLPDFFADDIVIDAAKMPRDMVEVPSDNFLLHLTGQSNAVTTCVFEHRKQDAQLLLGEEAGQRIIKGSEICLEGKKAWVAVLEAPHVWHTIDIKASDSRKEVALDWKMPFPGQWRVDFTRPNGLTDSWEMLLQKKDGGQFVKPSWLGAGDDRLPANRRRWNTVLGTFRYPAWSDPDGNGFLEPLRHRELQFEGPVIIYPIHRVAETPLAAFTVVDVMRSTLGVGPCEYLLDLEGQKAEYKGRATCSSRDVLLAIYTKGQQKQKRDEIEKVLQDDLIFVTHIRGRITRYVEFGHNVKGYLAEQRQSHPELAEFLTAMDQLAGEIDARVAKRADKIKTLAHVAAMNEDFRREVLDYDGADAVERCRKYATALVTIGDNQDELSGECRWVVKSLRQQAGLWMARDPRTAVIAGEIRTRTQEALRYPANHEGAHH